MSGKDITKFLVGAGVFAVLGGLGYVMALNLLIIEALALTYKNLILGLILIVILPLPAYLVGHGIMENMSRKGH